MQKEPDINDVHPLAELIIKLKNQGYPAAYIVNQCNKDGYNFTVKQIKAYIDKKKAENPPPKEVKEPKETKVKKKSGRQPLVVNLDEFSKRFNIPDDLSDVDSIMTVLQRMSARAVMVQYGCVIEKIEAHARGEIDKSPDDQIKSLKLLLDCFARLWGSDKMVDISAAMQTVAAQGYRIDAINAIEETAAKLDSATVSGDDE